MEAFACFSTSVGVKNKFVVVGGAEEGEDKFGRIGKEDHDYVTLSDSELVEAGGDAAGSELDVIVGVVVADWGIHKAEY